MTQEQAGVTWRTVAAPAISIQGTTVVPETRVFHVPWPAGGLVWSHPIRVRVLRAGAEQAIPIIDITWAAVMFLRAVTVVALALAAVISLRSKSRRKWSNGSCQR